LAFQATHSVSVWRRPQPLTKSISRCRILELDRLKPIRSS
jgi:hypothetical protein